MNPKLTNKQKELSLLQDTLNNLKKIETDPEVDLYTSVTIDNAIFNIQRTIDLINGIY